jgi:hypothetical protein
MTEHNPKKIINPIHVNTVTPGSVGALTTREIPDTVILKVRATAPEQSSQHTFLFHLNRDDAEILHAELSVCLKRTAI